MPASDDHPTIRNLGTVYEPRDEGLRYMRRRRLGTADRNGDPLDGVVNLFYVAIVLAVAFLVAALWATGLGGLLSSASSMTIVSNPGTPQMRVIVKSGDTIRVLRTSSGSQAQGAGTLVGSFYKLTDGTLIYVPGGSPAPTGSTPVPGTTPAPTTTDYPTTNPYASPVPSDSASAASPGATTVPSSAATPDH
ncbi:MAG: DUF2149 domain-containing protein [Actinomycetes bacterium]